MENAYIQRYNDTQMIHNALATYEHDYTKDFDSQFSRISEVVVYDIYIVDHQ